jgi:hypothetical protein
MESEYQGILHEVPIRILINVSTVLNSLSICVYVCASMCDIDWISFLGGLVFV